MEEVNKELGLNVEKTIYKRWGSWEGKKNSWGTNRRVFLDYLEEQGYSTFTDRNYITIEKDGEKRTLYFLSHMSNIKNYLAPKNLRYKVDYFCFYDSKTDKVYKVSYSIVSEYCKTLKTSVYFSYGYDNQKLLIPDSWVRKQDLNVINC